MAKQLNFSSSPTKNSNSGIKEEASSFGLTAPINQSYEFELYSVESVLIGLRVFGDLEFVCESFSELENFFKQRKNNIELEQALLGYLTASYKQDYIKASFYVREILRFGYSVEFVIKPNVPTIIRIISADIQGSEAFLNSLPRLDPYVFGGYLGHLLNACIFACFQYEFEIFPDAKSILGFKVFGQHVTTAGTLVDLAQAFDEYYGEDDLKETIKSFLGEAFSSNYRQAAYYLYKIYQAGYSLRLAKEAGLPVRLRVMKDSNGGIAAFEASILNIDASVSDHRLTDFVNICLSATQYPRLTNYSECQYGIQLNNSTEPFLTLYVGDHAQFSCNSADELASILKKREINIELELAIADFFQAALNLDYCFITDNIAVILKYKYLPKFVIDRQKVIFLIAADDEASWDKFRQSLPFFREDIFINDLKKLAQACIYSYRKYEFEIYNIPSPVLGIKIFGELKFKCNSSDDIERFLIEPEIIDSAEKHLGDFFRSSFEMNYIPASKHLRQCYRKGYFVRLIVSPGILTTLQLIKGHGDGWEGLSQSLLELDISIIGGDLQNILTACMVACLHGLYVEGKVESAQQIAGKFLNARSNHVIEDIRIAQESFNNHQVSHPLTVSLATGSDDYLDFFKGKTCNHPFSDFEVATEGRAFVCCPSYLPDSIGNIFNAKSIDDVIQSKKANLIRESIKKQDFRFCRWLHCKEIDSLPSLTSPKVKTDIYPIDFRLSFDTTCNLWCITCRSSKINIKGKQREIMTKATDEIILPLLKNARSVTMNGYGEVFASRPCRNILQKINPENNPNLIINMITNAVLFTEQDWQNFKNIHKMMGTVRISIDAATKETYDKIRLGGDWDQLMKNLKFISRLRDEKVIKRLIICFVYQRDNFREMAEFAELGKNLGCDLVIFDALLNWNTFTHEELSARSVHYPTNALHDEFLNELKRLRAVLPTSAPHLTWLQEHANKRITLLSLDSRF